MGPRLPKASLLRGIDFSSAAVAERGWPPFRGGRAYRLLQCSMMDFLLQSRGDGVDTLQARLARSGASAPTLPFDVVRHLYAAAVTSGWRRKSLVESAWVERVLDRWEKAMLGSCARSR
jgi:hypothetical protein